MFFFFFYRHKINNLIVCLDDEYILTTSSPHSLIVRLTYPALLSHLHNLFKPSMLLVDLPSVLEALGTARTNEYPKFSNASTAESILRAYDINNSA